MSETSRRVALLARPGAARDNVRGALLEIGADIVVEEDPGAASPDAIRSTSPEVLMIVLDAVSENALDRFDSMLGDPAIEVMFEEADVAAARDGWEAARWRRHLAAKLHHRDDVLPPVAGAEVAPAVDPMALRIEELMSTGDAASPLDAQVELPRDAAGGDDFSIFDPAAAEAVEGGVEDYSLSVQGLELEDTAFDAGTLPADAGLSFEPDVFDHGDGADAVIAPFQPSGFDDELTIDGDAHDALPPVTGPDFAASDFDPLLAQLDAELPDLPLADAPVAEWQPDGFAPIDADTVSADDVAPAPSTPSPSAFGELSLADDATPVATARPAAPRTHDLGDLERRIAAMELVDESLANAGAVLVLAGIGGPDAVRQLLGALPARFERPVLIRQRLDGARYDKLVAQLQRASALPVALAQAGDALQPGNVYVMGDVIGLDARGTSFAADSADALIDRLPAAGSAVIVLSGADVGLADRIAGLVGRAAFVGAQSADGCYDAAAASALAARGAVSAAPSELAAQLVGRWGR